MIEVYKIGLEWYDKTEDKNGGLFEYRIIKQEYFFIHRHFTIYDY